jgi:hypothetical protein
VVLLPVAGTPDDGASPASTPGPVAARELGPWPSRPAVSPADFDAYHAALFDILRANAPVPLSEQHMLRVIDLERQLWLLMYELLNRQLQTWAAHLEQRQDSFQSLTGESVAWVLAELEAYGTVTRSSTAEFTGHLASMESILTGAGATREQAREFLGWLPSTRCSPALLRYLDQEARYVTAARAFYSGWAERLSAGSRGWPPAHGPQSEEMRELFDDLGRERDARAAAQLEVFVSFEIDLVPSSSS